VENWKMVAYQDQVEDFLAQKKIAVVGVSRSKNAPANLIYRKLRGTGYQVFAVNPKASRVEGDTCYPNLGTLPESPDGVVIVTPPETGEEIVEQCASLGVKRVWMHRSFGTGSVSDRAVTAGRKQGLVVIAGGCPMMFCEPVDFGHRCMRWILKISGGLGKTEK
jgi:predicted CoA-binding protein